MEKLDISEWTRRRAGALLGKAFQTAANFVPLPVVVSTGGGFTVKATLVGLVVTMPPKPGFAQLEGLPGNTGVVIDIFEEAILGTNALNVEERNKAMNRRRLITQSSNGTVEVAMSFLGADP